MYKKVQSRIFEIVQETDFNSYHFFAYPIITIDLTITIITITTIDTKYI